MSVDDRLAAVLGLGGSGLEDFVAVERVVVEANGFLAATLMVVLTSFLAAIVVETLEGCDESAAEGAETFFLKAVDLLAVVVGLIGTDEVVGQEAAATVGLVVLGIGAALEAAETLALAAGAVVGLGAAGVLGLTAVLLPPVTGFLLNVDKAAAAVFLVPLLVEAIDPTDPAAFRSAAFTCVLGATVVAIGTFLT